MKITRVAEVESAHQKKVESITSTGLEEALTEGIRAGMTRRDLESKCQD
jgi:hypothetical protein